MVKEMSVISKRATKVIILDDKAIVNSLPKDKESQVKTRKDFLVYVYASVNFKMR